MICRILSALHSKASFQQRHAEVNLFNALNLFNEYKAQVEKSGGKLVELKLSKSGLLISAVVERKTNIPRVERRA